MINSAIYREFIEAVATKYGVNFDEVKTYMFDGIKVDSDAKGVKITKEECGCYINGVLDDYHKLERI